MPGSVARIGSFLQKEFLCAGRIPYQEDRVGLRRKNSLLNFAQFDIENLAQLFVVQLVKHNQLVDSVHEFWGKPPLGCFDCHTMDLSVDGLGDLGGSFWSETDLSRRKLGHLIGAEIGRHKDDGSG